MSLQDVPSLQAQVVSLQTEIQALKVGGEQITIADYLLKRLEQLGVKVSLNLYRFRPASVDDFFEAYVWCSRGFQLRVPCG